MSLNFVKINDYEYLVKYDDEFNKELLERFKYIFNNPNKLSPLVKQEFLIKISSSVIASEFYATDFYKEIKDKFDNFKTLVIKYSLFDTQLEINIGPEDKFNGYLFSLSYV